MEIEKIINGLKTAKDKIEKEIKKSCANCGSILLGDNSMKPELSMLKTIMEVTLCVEQRF